MLRRAGLAKAAGDLLICETRAKETALLRVGAGLAGFFQELIPDKQGRAQRAAGVAGGRLNPEIVKGALAQQPAVGHAIQGHPAGQHQVSFPV